MKKNTTYKIRLFIIFFGVAISLSSCQKNEVADAPYPDPMIYMPAAINGNFVINSLDPTTVNVPTAGSPYRFKVDSDNKKFVVPLAIYNSRVTDTENFKIDININTDTITKLIASGSLSGAVLLPADRYSIIPSVEMPNDQAYVTFDLNIDLDYLRNSNGKTFAIGIGISSTGKNTNPKLNTTIVVIDSRILNPVADFTYHVDETDSKKISFTNSSSYALTYSWDFGDGSTVSTEKAPSHIFSGSEDYTVRLTATGVTGDQVSKDIMIAIN